MSRGFNKVILSGNLVRAADVRVTVGGQKSARFSLAVGQVWKDKATGERKERADFISCVAWGPTAEVIERYTDKGKLLLLEGRLSVRDFDDVKSGMHKWVTEVVVTGVVLLGGGSASGESSNDSGRNNNDYGASNNGNDGYGGARPNGPKDLGYGKPDPFDDDFPMDFSELGGGPDEIEIPF
ncbi:MAG: single-stranded DNA-binding protein [bacterium]|nr:single-stranded DNA-binding protein [bacterium]